MAKIGLTNFRYGILTEAANGTPSYAGALTPAKAISCNVEVTRNEAKLYADDILCESDSGFAGGTVTIGIDEDDQATMATLLGHSVSDNAMIRNADDTAPYVGFGRVVTKMVGGQLRYKVEFIYKVKFGEPNQEDTTKGESMEFSTTELEGQIAALANGKWSITKTFTTKAEAVSYLEGLLGGASGGTTATVTYNVNGGTGSVAAVTVTKGAMITLDDGSGLTPPSDKVFDGWDTTSSATHGDLTGTYIVTENVTLYAIWVTE